MPCAIHDLAAPLKLVLHQGSKVNGNLTRESPLEATALRVIVPREALVFLCRSSQDLSGRSR